MEFGFFGSAVLWLLVTFPAYWLFQWTIEGEPFSLWQRPSGEAGASLSSASAFAPLDASEPAFDTAAMS